MFNKSKCNEINFNRYSLVENTSIEADEDIQHCLKIFAQNKICSANAWELRLIDRLELLVTNHHKHWRNFNNIGSTLEASSKIYGLRVDAVHKECIGLANRFSRKRRDTQVDANGNDTSDICHEVDDIHCEQNVFNEPTKIPRQPRRRRKLVHTITKNKDTINAKLDTRPLIDSLISRWNSIPGDVNSTSKLFNNILRTECSELKMQLDYPYFDSTINDAIEYQSDHIYELDDATDWINIDLNVDRNCTLRQHNLYGYRITNTIDDDVIMAKRVVVNHAIDQVNTANLLDLAFDMDAAVEQEQCETTCQRQSSFEDDLVDLDEYDNNDDVMEISSVSELFAGSKRTRDQSEYSYGNMVDMKHYWAGPTYWKYGRNAKRTKFSEVNNNSISNGNKNAKKTPRKKKMKIPIFESVLDLNDQSADDADLIDESFSNFTSCANNSRRKRLYPRWSACKLKLPIHCNVPFDLFDHLSFAKSLPAGPKMWENIKKEEKKEIESDSDSVHDIESLNDFEFIEDNQICGSDEDEVASLNAGNDHGDLPVAQLRLSQDSMSEQHTRYEYEYSQIATTFDGAPEDILQTSINYARVAKVVDMKTLKKRSKRLIENHFELQSIRNTRDGTKVPLTANFEEIYEQLPNVLTAYMRANLTVSIAFYAILHLCNEHGYTLQKTNTNKFTFVIRKSVAKYDNN